MRTATRSGCQTPPEGRTDCPPRPSGEYAARGGTTTSFLVGERCRAQSCELSWLRGRTRDRCASEWYVSPRTPSPCTIRQGTSSSGFGISTPATMRPRGTAAQGSRARARATDGWREAARGTTSQRGCDRPCAPWTGRTLGAQMPAFVSPRTFLDALVLRMLQEPSSRLDALSCENTTPPAACGCGAGAVWWRVRASVHLGGGRAAAGGGTDPGAVQGGQLRNRALAELRGRLRRLPPRRKVRVDDRCGWWEVVPSSRGAQSWVGRASRSSRWARSSA